METVRMGAGRNIAFSFFRQHMDHYRSFHPFCLVEQLHHLAHIVSVHRAQVGKSHIFKKHSRDEQLLDAAFGLAHSIHNGRSHSRDLGELFVTFSLIPV